MNFLQISHRTFGRAPFFAPCFHAWCRLSPILDFEWNSQNSQLKDCEQFVRGRLFERSFLTRSGSTLFTTSLILLNLKVVRRESVPTTFDSWRLTAPVDCIESAAFPIWSSPLVKSWDSCRVQVCSFWSPIFGFPALVFLSVHYFQKEMKDRRATPREWSPNRTGNRCQSCRSCSTVEASIDLERWSKETQNILWSFTLVFIQFFFFLWSLGNPHRSYFRLKTVANRRFLSTRSFISNLFLKFT